jgi:hypothetical protein
MSRWTPCSRRDFVRRLHRLGFERPFSGTRHQFMVYHEHRLAIPSNVEYSVPQLASHVNSRNRSDDRIPNLLGKLDQIGLITGQSMIGSALLSMLPKRFNISAGSSADFDRENI